MDSSIHTYADALAALVQKVGPAVFAIHGRRHTTSSGVHWRNGYIVTAEHTLRRDEDIAVTGSAGEEAKAQLVGRDPVTDLALLHLENLNAPPAAVGSSEGLRPGDL